MKNHAPFSQMVTCTSRYFIVHTYLDWQCRWCSHPYSWTHARTGLCLLRRYPCKHMEMVLFRPKYLKEINSALKKSRNLNKCLFSTVPVPQYKDTPLRSNAKPRKRIRQLKSQRSQFRSGTILYDIREDWLLSTGTIELLCSTMFKPSRSCHSLKDRGGSGSGLYKIWLRVRLRSPESAFLTKIWNIIFLNLLTVRYGIFSIYTSVGDP